jgi:hypothetical protein
VIAWHVVVFMINTMYYMNNTSLRMYPGAGPLPEAPGAPLPARLTMLIVNWLDSM